MSSSHREAGSSNKDRGGSPKRTQTTVALGLCAAVVTALFLCFSGSSLGDQGKGPHVEANPSGLETLEARRLLRLLVSAQDSQGEPLVANLDPSPQFASDQSSSLLAAIGEKNIKCETALTQCTKDLDKTRNSATADVSSSRATSGDGADKDQQILSLQAEVERLTKEVMGLKAAAMASMTPEERKRKMLLANAEGDLAVPLTLEAAPCAKCPEPQPSAKCPEPQPSAKCPEPKPSPQHVSCEGIPGLSKELEQQAKENARKVLEECGVKSKPVVANAGSKNYACEATEAELQQYFNYTRRAECPDDWYFVLELVYVKGCSCLPTRDCFAPSPANYVEPSIPFPQSLFDPAVLRNENVRWENQYWPNYEALNHRVLGDCRDCFNLTLEETRWQVNFMGTIPMKDMLALKQPGSFKIGLDAGGGTGSFAAKMAEHGVTIVTTAMNTETLAGDKKGGLPYMETIAQRGLIPLFVPHKVRQPFFDGTLDLVHNINSIKYFTIPEFETLLFEWDRILRPGGVMWFELFYAPVAEMPLYISVLEMFGYKKLYWNMTPKVDAAERNDQPHVYLNAVLEKPRRSENPPPLKLVSAAR